MPTGGSPSCTSVLWPRISTDAALAVAEVAAERDDGPHEEGGHEGEVGRQLEHEAVGPLGIRSSLKNSLVPSARVWSRSPGPGLVRPDPVLHAGDDLALEPHHEHGADEADHEDDEHLHDDEDDVAEGDAADQQIGSAANRFTGSPSPPIDSMTTSVDGGTELEQLADVDVGLVERRPRPNRGRPLVGRGRRGRPHPWCWTPCSGVPSRHRAGRDRAGAGARRRRAPVRRARCDSSG